MLYRITGTLVREQFPWSELTMALRRDCGTQQVDMTVDAAGLQAARERAEFLLDFDKVLDAWQGGAPAVEELLADFAMRWVGAVPLFAMGPG